MTKYLSEKSSIGVVVDEWELRIDNDINRFSGRSKTFLGWSSDDAE